MAGLGIEPAKVRLPGISAAVAWLDPDAIAEMDQAAARVASGESVAQVCADVTGQVMAERAPIRNPSRPDADPGQFAAMVAAIVAAMETRRDPSQPVAALPPAQPSEPAPEPPLARARALREAAAEGLMLTTDELAHLTGKPAEAIERLRSGSRLQGYRVWKLPGTSADPEPVWRLSEAEWARGVVERLQGRD